MSTAPFRQDQDKLESHFRTEVTVIESQIKLITGLEADNAQREGAIKKVLSSIADLKGEVNVVAPDLPAHAQRTYAETISRLATSLQEAREASQPKKKFSFKRQPKASESKLSKDGTGDGVAEKRSVAGADGKPGLSPESVNEPLKPRNAQATNISDLKNTCYVLNPVDVQGEGFATLSNLSRCVVNLSTVNSQDRLHAGMTLSDIHKSLMICGMVRGPIHLTKQVRMVILVGCQQFRMHESHDCDVYLHCGSRPIIEACSNIRFAPAPQSLIKQFQREGSSLPNRWDQVDDFKWLKTEPSPNWKLIPEDSRIASQTWTELTHSMSEDVDELLEKAGIKQ